MLAFKLLDLLDSDLKDPAIRKEVKTSMKEFTQLLSKADWRYMGGEDVWEALKSLPQEMNKRLRASTVSVSRMKTSAKRPMRAAAKRVTKVVKKKTKARRK
jgi:hypothetical protein